jgi:hypothetical protein
MDMNVRGPDDQCMTPPVSAGRLATASRALTLRTARPDDDLALRRLAQLDSSRPPTGPVLLAVVGSEPVAALSVETGAVVADPFRPTADVVAVLRQAAA